MFCFLKGKTEKKNEKHVKYDSGKEQKKKIYIVDPVEKCCQFTRVAFFFSTAHTDPGELKNMWNTITLEFMQWYDSIGLRTTKNWYITDCYVQLIFRHTESYGVISLHELGGNGVSHVFELAWISVRRAAYNSRHIYSK